MSSVSADRQTNSLYIDLSVCLSLSVYLSRHLFLSALSAHLKSTTIKKQNIRLGVYKQKQSVFKTDCLVIHGKNVDM